MAAANYHKAPAARPFAAQSRYSSSLYCEAAAAWFGNSLARLIHLMSVAAASSKTSARLPSIDRLFLRPHSTENVQLSNWQGCHRRRSPDAAGPSHQNPQDNVWDSHRSGFGCNRPGRQAPTVLWSARCASTLKSLPRLLRCRQLQSTIGFPSKRSPYTACAFGGVGVLPFGLRLNMNSSPISANRLAIPASPITRRMDTEYRPVLGT